MEKKSFNEIVDILKSTINKEDFEYLQLDKYLNILNLGKIECVSSYGGEDKGSEFYNVQYFVDHDVYIKLEGYYSSYEGVDYGGFDYEEVRPIQKTITVYE